MWHDVLSVAAYSKISDKFLEGVGQMPFLSPKQRCQNTDRITKH